MDPVTPADLPRLRRRYRALQDQVRTLGFIAPGSVLERTTVCGTAGCRCHGDPPIRHGPYFQYTRKVAGKTLTRRLTADQAQRYREWIANRRRLDQLLAAMDELSRQAGDLLLFPPPPLRPAATRRPDRVTLGADIASQKCGMSVAFPDEPK